MDFAVNLQEHAIPNQCCYVSYLSIIIYISSSKSHILIKKRQVSLGAICYKLKRGSGRNIKIITFKLGKVKKNWPTRMRCHHQRKSKSLLEGLGPPALVKLTIVDTPFSPLNQESSVKWKRLTELIRTPECFLSTTCLDEVETWLVEESLAKTKFSQVSDGDAGSIMQVDVVCKKITFHKIL